jgi:hypothetical protein
MLDATHVSVCSTIAAYVDVDPTLIKPDQALHAHWGLGPRQRSGLAARIEQVEKIGLRGDELAGIDTIGQLIKLVKARQITTPSSRRRLAG